MKTVQGLPGATVLEKGTTNGTFTDVDGNYSLSVEEGATLVFSFVGYHTEEVAVGNNTKIDLSLLPDISRLNEVVVVGYGTQQREDFTGSLVFSRPESLF